ncbi:MAG TPA: response regulator [Myxococcota bacterium]|jgi:DNA-binding NtrC family response regulator|nr:response regulator [Myxococcota bacterium]
MSLKLLLIDDDDGYRSLLLEFLTSNGHSVWGFASAEEALRHMSAPEHEAPGLVLTDMCMDRMTGLELARAVRRAHPRVPIILMTAFGERRLAEEALGLGRSGYLEKPFRLADLAAEIGRVLAPDGG